MDAFYIGKITAEEADPVKKDLLEKRFKLFQLRRDACLAYYKRSMTLRSWATSRKAEVMDHIILTELNELLLANYLIREPEAYAKTPEYWRLFENVQKKRDKLWFLRKYYKIKYSFVAN